MAGLEDGGPRLRRSNVRKSERRPIVRFASSALLESEVAYPGVQLETVNQVSAIARHRNKNVWSYS